MLLTTSYLVAMGTDSHQSLTYVSEINEQLLKTTCADNEYLLKKKNKKNLKGVTFIHPDKLSAQSRNS